MCACGERKVERKGETEGEGEEGREEWKGVCVRVRVYERVSVLFHFFTFSLFHFFTFLLGHPRPSHLSRPSYHSSYPPLYCIQALTRTGEQVEESNSEKQTINKQTT